MDDVDKAKVVEMGRAVRFHPRFQPAGTNANFVQIMGANRMAVRTYERGVEDETLACGTGSIAAVLLSALKGLVDRIAEQHAPGSALRVQVLHSQNPRGASVLRELLDQRFDCTWLPVGPMSLVLGAHTGPSMVGVAYAPAAAFADIP